MTHTPRSPYVVRAWIVVFGVWGALLSGAFAHWLGEGSPGVIQALRLSALLDSRNEQLGSLQAQLDRLGSEAESLERSRVTQFREIREVLGYSAPDEIIFDFSSPDAI